MCVHWTLKSGSESDTNLSVDSQLKMFLSGVQFWLIAGNACLLRSLLSLSLSLTPLLGETDEIHGLKGHGRAGSVDLDGTSP